MMSVSVLSQLVEGRHLTQAQAQAAMLDIMHGNASPTYIAAFLVALRMKGETIEEVTGFASAMRDMMVTVKPTVRPLVDTCGTGGDSLKTFNISTAAAFVAAGAGVAIAKHGNRAVSSKCGSADVLEALGVRIDLPAEQVSACIDEIGIGFMFAQAMHPAMKHAGPVRKEMAIRTVFNMLGPLANPALAQAQVLGVYSPTLTEYHAQVLKNLGSQRAFVVHGLDGLDEISTIGETQISELRNGEVLTYTITPEELGIQRVKVDDLRSGVDAKKNGEILRHILEGEQGPRRDIVLVNAAAALVAAEKTDDLSAGLVLAAESIDSGKALAKLEALQAYSAKS
jgi:anthranilate phosphoribosyltransferase